MMKKEAGSPRKGWAAGAKMATFEILELRLGRARPFGPKGALSAIDKQPLELESAVELGPNGLAGDEQGDPRHHGGPDKAVHAYPLAHYALWRAEHPEVSDSFVRGGFGENLVVGGLDESGVCLGDLWQVGACLLQVSQGRQPCWKLNLRFGLPDMARKVQDSGRSGWYFRVLRGGQIAAPAIAQLVGRPHAEWPLSRVSDLLYHDRLNTGALAELAQIPGLPISWQRLVQARLNSGRVEDWDRRILTP